MAENRLPRSPDSGAEKLRIVNGSDGSTPTAQAAAPAATRLAVVFARLRALKKVGHLKAFPFSIAADTL